MTIRRNRLMLVLAVADTLIALGAGTASARTVADPLVRQQMVATHDLDLATDAGRARLDQRVHKAVARVCDDGRLVSLDAHECRVAAMRDARVQTAALIAGQSSQLAMATK